MLERQSYYTGSVISMAYTTSWHHPLATPVDSAKQGPSAESSMLME